MATKQSGKTAKKRRRTAGKEPKAAERAARASTAPTARVGFFTTPDGADLYFEDTGGDHPVLFYIYGLGCQICHWKYPMAYFAPAASLAAGRRPHRQVWMDLRGHGRSPLPRQRHLTMDIVVEDIRALCAYRGIDQATFLGQSMGGSIALALAHAAPDLVKGLVLLASPGRNPGAFLPLQPFAGWIWRGLIEFNRRVPLALRVSSLASRPLSQVAAIRLPLRELVRQHGFNPKLARTDDIDEYVGTMFENDPNIFFDLAGELADFDVAKFDPPISSQAVVIAGANDHLIPLTEAQRLTQHLPNSRFEVIAHGSHCPHFDDPALVNRLIEGFLSKQGL